MIIENITLGKSEYKLGPIPMVDFVKVNAMSLSNIRKLVNATPDKNWLNEATYQAMSTMDNCSKKLIREARRELDKAKTELKKNHPIRYKLSFWKVIIKNPIKSLLCRLM